MTKSPQLVPPPTDLPKVPDFINPGTLSDYEKPFQETRAELERLIKAHKAGEAIILIITKLMPEVENYRMDYVQGNIANEEAAASYTLKMVNYIEGKFGEEKNYDPYEGHSEGRKNAGEALYAEHELYEQIKKHGKIFGSAKEVLEQLEHATSISSNIGNGVSYDPKDVPTEQDAQNLAQEWERDWLSTTKVPKDPDKPDGPTKTAPSDGLNKNAIVMQAFNAAQNQVQSAAAYLQSEQKIANQDYQKYAAAQHDIEQNIVELEKTSNNSMVRG